MLVRAKHPVTTLHLSCLRSRSQLPMAPLPRLSSADFLQNALIRSRSIPSDPTPLPPVPNCTISSHLAHFFPCYPILHVLARPLHPMIYHLTQPMSRPTPYHTTPSHSDPTPFQPILSHPIPYHPTLPHSTLSHPTRRGPSCARRWQWWLTGWRSTDPCGLVTC